MEESIKFGNVEAVSESEWEYVSPEIISYHCDELLEKLGPARACSSSPTCPTSDI